MALDNFKRSYQHNLLAKFLLTRSSTSRKPNHNQSKHFSHKNCLKIRTQFTIFQPILFHQSTSKIQLQLLHNTVINPKTPTTI